MPAIAHADAETLHIEDATAHIVPAKINAEVATAHEEDASIYT